MTQARHPTAFAPLALPGRSAWLPSWPLITAAYVYLLTLYQGNILGLLLRDGDTYWHIAAGRWIVEHGAIPTRDPFSYTMPGAPWTAHEWLSEVILAQAHAMGGWQAVIALSALAFAAAIGLLTRALLVRLDPIRAVLFTVLAVMLTTGHLLARPHILALPVMTLWMVELVRARDEHRAPGLLLAALMILWANLHGSFTLGIAITGAFAFEAAIEAWRTPQFASTVRAWMLFMVAALVAAMLTPHGAQAFLFTWQVMANSSYALDHIGEWSSPNFHLFQPVELWLMAGLALTLYQGLRLPPVRLVLVLGLLHLSLKHVRNIELLGLLGPLFVASPFAAQWRRTVPESSLDHIALRLAEPARAGAWVLFAGLVLAAPGVFSHIKPAQPPEAAAPVHALQAVQDAHVEGPVFHEYGWGGFLIYRGIAPFIDGRAEMYGDEFMKTYVEALELRTSDALPKLLDRYHVRWTLLPPGMPAVALLDHLPGWRRLYSDDIAVVHVRSDVPPAAVSERNHDK
jgi:hypothetical protein